MNTHDTVTDSLIAACRDAEDCRRQLENGWWRIRPVTVLAITIGVTLVAFGPAPLFPTLLIVAGVTSAAVYIELVHRADRAAFNARCALAKYTGATETEMALLINSGAETDGGVR